MEFAGYTPQRETIERDRGARIEFLARSRTRVRLGSMYAARRWPRLRLPHRVGSDVRTSLFIILGPWDLSDLVASIQEGLVQVLIPTRQEEISEYLARFVGNTQALGVVGLLVFLVTSILLMAAVQRTFDRVWGATSRGVELGRLVTYGSVLIVGSFLLNIGLNLAGAVRTLVGTAVADIQVNSSLFFIVVPRVIVFASLFLMIKLVPIARISTASAVWGALIGALFWALARVIFIFWTNQVMRLSIVYGSLAAIPIFLLWLYVGWMIVLCSLEVTFVHQYRIHRRGSPDEFERGPALHLLLGLRALLYSRKAVYCGHCRANASGSRANAERPGARSAAHD